MLAYNLVVQEVHGDGGLVVPPDGLATREPEEARARRIHGVAQDFTNLLLRHAVADLFKILLVQTRAAGRQAQQQDGDTERAMNAHAGSPTRSEASQDNSTATLCFQGEGTRTTRAEV